MEKSLKSKLPGGTFAGVSSTRSRIMASISGKSNKSTEMALRLALVRAGLRGWKLHTSAVQGRPDFFFPRKKLAIFVDGCFWHSCPKCGHTPETRRAFWSAKLLRNRERDIRNTRALRRGGIHVIRFWEHSLGNERALARTVNRIKALLNKTEP